MAKLDHVRVYITDLEKSIKFYERMFGLKVVDTSISGEAKIATLDIGGDYCARVRDHREHPQLGTGVTLPFMIPIPI